MLNLRSPLFENGGKGKIHHCMAILKKPIFASYALCDRGASSLQREANNSRRPVFKALILDMFPKNPALWEKGVMVLLFLANGLQLSLPLTVACVHAASLFGIRNHNLISFAVYPAWQLFAENKYGIFLLIKHSNY